MKIPSSSAWSLPQISQFLSEQVIPIRLAVHDDGYPLICSVWFMWDAEAGELLCASHEGSYLVSRLQKNARIGFEVAPETPPYKGVRGKANVSLVREGVADVLPGLIDRYLADRNDSLAKWLLSRVDEEYLLRIKPGWITSWDYSARMKGG
jgi:uncharacterized protein YhbP (UPF0306 family)